MKPGVTRAEAQVQRNGAPSCFATHRTRKPGNALPKKLREKIYKLAADRALTLIDAWYDPDDSQLTLVVDQDGYSTTKFVIEYQNAYWQVTVRANTSRDTDSLLAERQKLESRFKMANLGPVILG